MLEKLCGQTGEGEITQRRATAGNHYQYYFVETEGGGVFLKPGCRFTWQKLNHSRLVWEEPAPRGDVAFASSALCSKEVGENYFVFSLPSFSLLQTESSTTSSSQKPANRSPQGARARQRKGKAWP